MASLEELIDTLELSRAKLKLQEIERKCEKVNKLAEYEEAEFEANYNTVDISLPAQLADFVKLTELYAETLELAAASLVKKDIETMSVIERLLMPELDSRESRSKEAMALFTRLMRDSLAKSAT